MTDNRLNELLTDLWQRIEKHRGFITPDKVVPFIAALLFLRWAEYIDIEREATAKLDGRSHDPILPKEAKWSSLENLAGRELQEAFNYTTQSALKTPRPYDVTYHLHPIVGVLEHFSRHIDLSDDARHHALHLIVKWVGLFDCSSTDGREFAAKALEKLLYETIKEARRTEFITPPPIVKKMVDLVTPEPGDRIYDPCSVC